MLTCRPGWDSLTEAVPPRFPKEGVSVRRWSIVFAIVLVVFLTGMVGTILWLQRDLPSPSLLETMEPALGTTVYAHDGRVVHEFFRENRVLVRLDDLDSSYVVDAILAAEDQRFREHWGVDVFGIIRATITNVRAGRVVQGASTITQQLARNLFLTQEVSLTRKVREALLALRIERTFTKDRILELYLNQIYFGDGMYGVQAAAEYLFDKDASELSLEEAALIAGVIQSPQGYAPRRHEERALRRRSTVLSMMAMSGAVTREEAARADTTGLGIVEHEEVVELGAYFIEHVRREIIDRYGAEALYSGGLRIYTTIDLDLQQVAEQQVEERLTALEVEAGFPVKRGEIFDADSLAFIPYVQGALLALDVRTGGILAMVGGRDFKDSPFNRVTQAPRQPGSGFKPFLYTAAIDNGFSPADTILDAPLLVPAAGTPITFRDIDPDYEEPTDWWPVNYARDFQGVVRLRYALKKSINLAAVRLGMQVGPQTVADYASRMGISTPLYPVYSLPLGSAEVTLWDMVKAYSVLANQGVRLEPYGIERVEDRSGRILEEHSRLSQAVLAPETAYVVTNMMESVMTDGTGWGARARGFQHPAAGKTGTTNDYADAWFIGFTPKIVCGVWTGYDERKTLGPRMSGARVALPIWTEFMKAAHVGVAREPFPRPPGVTTRLICSRTGLLATEDCPDVLNEVFVQGSEPVRHCGMHSIPERPPALRGGTLHF